MSSPTFPACCGNCSQGRRICTTPQACQMPEADDGQPTRQAVPEGGALALLLVVAIAASTVGLRWLARVFG